MNQLRIVSLLLLTGCGAFEPSEDWTEFDPPRQYQLWHQEVEICVGAERSFEDIIWRKVHARFFACDVINEATGCFDHPRTIYLVEYLLDYEPLVKAEIIHYIRQDGPHDALFRQCEGK